MTPTNKLRFVEREIETNAAYGNYFVRVKVKILQQWWEPDSGDLAGVGPE